VGRSGGRPSLSVCRCLLLLLLDEDMLLSQGQLALLLGLGLLKVASPLSGYLWNEPGQLEQR
jgi:hypothetical protein